MHMKNFLVNLFGYGVMFAWTLGFTLLSWPFLMLWKLCSGWSMPRVTRFFIWLYGRGWIFLMRPVASLQVSGLRRDEVPVPCVFVANHLSFFDVYCMGALPVSNFSIVVRSWPFRIPFYAPFMHLAEYLNSEQADPELLARQCSRILQQQGCILCFPEGHRSRDGRLGRFYSGAFKIAVDNQVPVVPLVIRHTDQLLPAGSWSLKPARMELRGLKAVYPDHFADHPLPHVAMRKHVKALMVEALEP
jgi:1-acyl-sn-glycerol-3-phosphate acyltransferase